MKKIVSVLIAVIIAAALFAGCSGSTQPAEPTAAPVVTEAPATEATATEVPATETPATEVPATEEPTEEPVADNTVNLMDLYTVTDPEGVEYDTRRVFHSETTEDNYYYASGLRHEFNVLYGKDDKAVSMCSVMVFETGEQAAAYVEEEESGTVDGSCVVTVSDASFFEMMSAVIPDLQGWIDNLTTSGMTEIEG